MSLVARYLEGNGIPTVVMGCAKDIVEYAGVPRFLFSDFPLGNPAGKPHEPELAGFTLELALRVLESAPGAAHHGAVAAALERRPDWKLDYSNIARLPPEEIARRRAEFDQAEGDRQDAAREGRRRQE